MAQLSQNTALAASAVADVYAQYKNAPIVVAFANLIGAEAQEIENALWQIYSQMGLTTQAPGFTPAVGAQLDLMGKILNLPRTDPNDALYLALLIAQSLVLRSSGRLPEIERVLSIVLPGGANTVTITELFPAAFLVDLSAQPITAQFAAVYDRIVQQLRGGGILAQLLYTSQTLANTFTTDIGPGLDTGYLSGVLN